MSFAELHPALQHHVVNSLGWRALRPLQEEAIGPLLGGAHAVLIAPTAGGKTEAAVLPVLSRMLTEDWRGLSVLYVCPIKALLNDLAVRLERYAGLVGRRVASWHGDVGAAARRRIVADPPDVLLTTPESLEVMLVSRRSEPRTLFARVRSVVVDELHAFAGDDRGWHLLAVLERIQRLAGRDLQRVGLSATVGNPDAMLAWLAGSSRGARRVVAPEASADAETEVTLDYVGDLANAATVIARLHRGDKRLVFCDSRARVEQLASRLRTAGVETFVSHSSLGADERRRAERAFAAARDCVIVATSTLELGIDVGDLDRVVQIDAPWSVASFLQRLGRSGRRPGTRRNCLFLTTTHEAFLRAAGLARLWGDGEVEPVTPPPAPYHILAQQILALALQHGGIGRHTWREWIGGMPGFAALLDEDVERVVAHMIAQGLLFDDGGILGIGRAGEAAYGRRHFLELVSVFTSEPLLSVRHGHDELGRVHATSFQMADDRPPVLLLAGRSWRVTHVDWTRRRAFATPTTERGRSQWLGSAQPLSFALCRAIRRVLAGAQPAATLTRRATAALAELRDEMSWVDDAGTAVVRRGDAPPRWWTFAGRRANAALARALGPIAGGRRVDELGLELAPDLGHEELVASLQALADGTELAPPVEAEAIDGLKFSQCLPRPLAVALLERRLADPEAVRACLSEPLRAVRLPEPGGPRSRARRG